MPPLILEMRYLTHSAAVPPLLRLRPKLASLSPIPSTVAFKNDGAWHSFTVTSSAGVKIEVNPSGTTARVEIGSASVSANFCSNGAEAEDSISASNGSTIKLAGCVAGTGTVKIYAVSDDTLIRTYTFNIATPLVCEPATNFSALRISASRVDVTWSAPTNSLTPTGYQVEVQRWQTTAWLHERYINEPATATRSHHLGIDRDSSYTYRLKTKCGTNDFSVGTSWVSVGSWSGSSGARGASGDEPAPTPGPTPTTPDKEEGDERPPTPR